MRLLLLGLFFPVRISPFFMQKIYASAISFFLQSIIHFRLSVIQKHVDFCFPEKTAAEKAQLIKKIYKHFFRICKLVHSSDTQVGEWQNAEEALSVIKESHQRWQFKRERPSCDSNSPKQANWVYQSRQWVVQRHGTRWGGNMVDDTKQPFQYG